MGEMGPQYLKQRVESGVGSLDPVQPQAKRHRDEYRQRESNTDPHQRSTNVHEQGAVLDQFGRTGNHLPGREENYAVSSGDD